MKSTSPEGTRVPTVTSIVLGVLVTLLLAGLFVGPKAASAAELVLFESDTCEWCERFHKEVGPTYPNTTESKCAPLRRVDIHDPRPDDLAHIKGIVFTPTLRGPIGASRRGRVGPGFRGRNSALIYYVY